ncbi:hypothetical protein D3C84_861960 [compost metagenome]
MRLPLLLSLLDGDMGSGDQLFHSLPHALTQYAGELGLALAGGADSLKQEALALRCQQSVAVEQCAPDHCLG